MGLPRFLVDENGNYLIEKHRLILLSSGRDLVLPPLIAQATAPVILAAPLYDESQAERYAVTANQGAATTTAKSLSALYFSPLPGALKEGEILKALFANRQQAVDYYELASATGPTLKRIVSPHILHLATHGFFLEDLHRHEESETGLDKGVSSVLKNVDTGNPLLRSGLALVNANLAVKAANDDQAGILSAEEVLDLHNWQVRNLWYFLPVILVSERYKQAKASMDSGGLFRRQAPNPCSRPCGLSAMKGRYA